MKFLGLVSDFFKWWLVFEEGSNFFTFYGKTAIVLLFFTIFIVIILVVCDLVNMVVSNFKYKYR